MTTLSYWKWKYYLIMLLDITLRQKKKPRVFFLIDFCPYCFYIFFDNFSFQRKYFILLAFYNICEITYLVLIDHLLDKEGTQRKLLI